jgi:hypothetical protein
MKFSMKVVLGSAALIASVASGSAFAMGTGVSQKDTNKITANWGTEAAKRGSAGIWCTDRAGCTTISGNKVAFCHMILKNQSGKWVQGKRWDKSWPVSAQSRLKDC